MRRRPVFWIVVSVLCFAGALYFWHLGEQWRRNAAPAAPAGPTNPPPLVSNTKPKNPGNPSGLPAVASSPPNSSPSPGPAAAASKSASRLPFRLSNTTQTAGELLQSDHAILLANALIDSSRPLDLSIPDSLRAKGDGGSYIVQARGPIDDDFRAMLKAAGATIVPNGYIPNNAYLVRIPAAGAQMLATLPQTQAVIPFEPYYKLSSSLLEPAVKNQQMPSDVALNLAVFPDALDQTKAALQQMGAKITAQEPSPFGPVLTVQPGANTLSDVASLSGVQMVERVHRRVHANDLSRVTTAEAPDTATSANYLGLSGTNVMVDVNDSGVDATHPDLSPRVTGDFAGSTVDVNGHGTHVAGIIASSGANSPVVIFDTNGVPNIGGSTTNANFRGKAPAANIFAMDLNASDSYLQETAARTNAFISNNSWNYGGDFSYDLAAASYDAAVRDALPEVTGPQPALYVFSSGDSGRGSSDGSGGLAGTVASPGTAKNVITVGALEQFRNITNDVVITTIDAATGTNIFNTSSPWAGQTDSSNEVASYSSRGNVGIGIEGDFGRFKPDVVAPGTFVVSTRSQQWDQNVYYHPTNYFGITFADTIQGFSSNSYSIFVPDNATALTINAVATNPPGAILPIFVSTSGSFGTNTVSIPPNPPAALSPANTTWDFTIFNPTNVSVQFSLETVLATTNNYGTTFDVLRSLNNAPGPLYRYETGTSMSAAEVSGTLALFQEYFQRLNITNSPALMKALLINGARSANFTYDFRPLSTLNEQGWGLINLTNSLPAALTNVVKPVNPPRNSPRPVLLFDPNPTNALATGQSMTYKISLNPDAQNQPLQVTLVWTDPPGNPAAGPKLVNNLDLIVTNLDNTNLVYFGNFILPGTTYNQAWDGISAPRQDFVNNVENVYLTTMFEPLGTNYSVTVFARAVNVNAVTLNTNNVVQDYALVISSGNGDANNLINLTNTPSLATSNTTNLTLITNSLPVLNQRVGASFQLSGTNTIPLTNTIWGTNGAITLGQTNQWHFFVVTNTDYGTNGNFTNAAFITFMPPNLSIPRIGVNANNRNNATRVEADIDLYVTTDSNLLILDPNAVANASKSLGRGGTESVVLSNSVPGTVYYVGVQSQDQQAAQFGFFGTFSDQPFSQFDGNGNEFVRGIPVPAPIPDGSPANPGSVMVFGIATESLGIRRVIVSDTIVHENFGDLLGTLTHDDTSVVLNNHTFGKSPDPLQTFIYEDNGEGDISDSRHTDGPGNLTEFIGKGGAGVWQLTMVDNALGHTGQVENLSIELQPQPITNGVVTVDLTVQPASFAFASVEVPANATNLTVSVTGNTAPVQLYLKYGSLPTQTNYDYTMTIIPPGGALSVGLTDLPPLTPGTYYIGVFNGSGIVQNVTVIATPNLDLAGAVPTTYTSTDTPVPIQDDAVTDDSIFVPVNLPVVSVNVGVLIQHPRVSDLALTLISPNGTRVLLAENRGGATTNGFGVITTNGSVSYLGFTEDTSLAQVPIKFATTFGQTNLPINLSDFESPAAGDYTNGVSVNGWAVQSNQVSVVINPAVARAGNQFLTLANGTISRSLPTAAGRNYTLSYAYRGPDIVGWWRGENTSAIDSISGITGTLTNGTSYTPSGKVNSAFDLGNNGMVIVSPSASLNVGTGPGMTLEGWIYPPDVIINEHPIFEWSEEYYFSGAHFFLNDLTAMGGGPADLYGNIVDTAGANHYIHTGPNVVSPNAWQHVALTYNKETGDSAIYYNGAVVVSANLGIFTPQTSATNYLLLEGRINITISPQNFRFSGLLDEMSVYGRALSTSEIKAIYSAGIAGKFDPAAPIPEALAKASVVFGGSTNLLFGNNTNWQTKVTSFTATTNGMPLQLTGLEPGMLVDSFALNDNSSNNLYYLPEESLGAVVGENALGAWTLEILDNRTGATNPAPQLVSWQLQFIFASNTAAPISLTHSVPVTNTIPANQILYYIVDVPPWANFATNILDSATLPVNVFFNQTNPPTGAGLGDFTLVNNQGAPPPVIGNPVLSAASTPPLVPGARYYLGVQNPNASPVTVVLEVDFDITALSNAVPLSGILSTNVPERYFSYDVSTNAIAVLFQLFNLNGNADLVARKGGPLPTLFSHDYGSFNPGTSPEYIVVASNSTPVALSPGRWYLGVFNRDVIDVSYTIEATEVVSPIVIPLTNALPLDFNSGPGPALTNFFSFTITNSASAALFELYNLSGNADLTLQRGALPLAPPYFGSSTAPGTNSEQIVIRTNGVLPDINGTWYLGVPNNDTNTVTYTIRAVVATNEVYDNGTVVVTNGILISGQPIAVTVSTGTNGVTLIWNAIDGENYEIDASTNLFNWSIVTNIIASGTTVTYVDTNAPAIPPVQFYQIKQIPVP